MEEANTESTDPAESSPGEFRPGVVPPLPAATRTDAGIGVCLSGGGLRAALFHLGALRYLHEQGVLGQVRTISSVSGGSILSGHLAERMIQVGLSSSMQFQDWERDVAVGFRQAASHDYRTMPVLSTLPWNWLWPGSRARAVIRRYRTWITGHNLEDLPANPEFVFCASDVVFGVSWMFRKVRTGDYRAGWAASTKQWSIAEAIGASACFPPVFGPLPMGLRATDLKGGGYRGKDRDDLVRRLALSDGGVYDNMALEPVWKDHQYVLVSDCGAPFRFEYSGTFVRRILRCASVAMNQAAAMRKRAFFSDIAENDKLRPPRYKGGYWGIAGTVDSYRDPLDPVAGYSEDLVSSVIDRIRTDLDRFTEAEMCVLENHGYLLAAAVMRRRRQDLLPQGPAPFPAVTPPHPNWMDEAKVRKHLADSHRRFSLRRLFGGL